MIEAFHVWPFYRASSGKLMHSDRVAGSRRSKVLKTPTEVAQLNELAWQQVTADIRKALLLAEEAAAEARRLEDELQLGMALRTVGACKLESGELGDARRALSTAQSVLENHPDSQPVLAQVLKLRSRTCFLNQDFEKALRFIHAALQASQESKDPQLRASVLNQAGTTYAHLGSYEEGLEYLLASLRVLEEAGLEPSGNPLNNIGNIYMLQGDPERAHDFFERARQTFDENGSGRDRIIAMGNVGRALEALGELENARRLFEESLALARDLDDRLYIPPALTKLGRVLGELGQKQEAFACLSEALSLCRGPSAPFRDEALLALARLHLRAGEPEDAERLYLEALALGHAHDNRQLEAEAHRGLSLAQENAGRWREALKNYQSYQELEASLSRDLFSNKTQALLLHNEVNQSKRDRKLLREMNQQLRSAYEELFELNQALEAQTAELERLSLEDPLTKLFNRRQLERRLSDEIGRLERYGEKFSVVMCDIDDFKSTNDRFSHGVGDEILMRFAQILREQTRATDVAARVGGDEFVLLLPHTGIREAAMVAEKIRSAVEQFAWESLGEGLEVTSSAGVTEAQAKQAASSLLAAADRELYRAKRSGKNSVCAGQFELRDILRR